MSRPKTVGLFIVFMWFLIGGIAHFAATETEMRIVPPYIPWPRAAVLVSGAFELLGAAGLLWRRTRRLAGVGLFTLTVLVTPAHIYMLQQPDLFEVPYWALVLRLPLQLALLALIAWATFSRRQSCAGQAGIARPSYLNDKETLARNATTLPPSIFMSNLLTSATRRCSSRFSRARPYLGL